VDSLQDRLWNTQSEIAPFVARVPVSNHEHTRLVLKELADFAGLRLHISAISITA
jgi:hypothetical protein